MLGFCLLFQACCPAATWEELGREEEKRKKRKEKKKKNKKEKKKEKKKKKTKYLVAQNSNISSRPIVSPGRRIVSFYVFYA